MPRVGVRVSRDGLLSLGRENSFRKLRQGSRQFVRVLKHIVSEEKLHSAKAIAITLTFRDMAAFIESKEREPKTGIAQFLHNVVQFVERKGVQVIGYGCVLELQARGVPHYHVLLVVSRYVRIPKPDQWCWPYGSSSIQSLGTVERLSVNYLAKYLQKPTQKGWTSYLCDTQWTINPETGQRILTHRDPLFKVKKFLWVIRLPEWREVFRWLRLPSYIRKFSYFFRELPKRVPYAGWWFRSAQYLIMTDARVLWHAGGIEKGVEGAFFKRFWHARRAPVAYVTFIYANYIGVLEGVDETLLQEVQRQTWEEHPISGAWFPLNIGVEAALQGTDCLSWDEVFTQGVELIP